MWGLWCLLVLVGGVCDDPVVIRAPIGDAGDVDLNMLLGLLADRAELTMERPTTRLQFPVDGLNGALTRKILTDTLSPEIGVEVRDREVRLTIAPSALTASRRPALQARIESLAALARNEAERRTRFGMHARPSYRPNDASRPTVCLIHGINSTSSVFVHMVPLLEQAGLGVVVYDFPYNRELAERSQVFAEDWARFRAQVGETQPWSIVAHSMGGLLARWYVEGASYRDDVAHLILLGPVNQGSRLASAQGLLQWVEGLQAVNQRTSRTLSHLGDGLGAAANDLMPGSPFLAELNRRARREGVQYHILAGDLGFLTADSRARLEARMNAMARSSPVLGSVARLAVRDLSARLDELSEGTGDGCIAVAATRLEGVVDHEVIHANHVELIRAPLLFPEPGPVVSMPFILKRLGLEAK